MVKSACRSSLWPPMIGALHEHSARECESRRQLQAMQRRAVRSTALHTRARIYILESAAHAPPLTVRASPANAAPGGNNAPAPGRGCNNAPACVRACGRAGDRLIATSYCWLKEDSWSKKRWRSSFCARSSCRGTRGTSARGHLRTCAACDDPGLAHAAFQFSVLTSSNTPTPLSITTLEVHDVVCLSSKNFGKVSFGDTMVQKLLIIIKVLRNKEQIILKGSGKKNKDRKDEFFSGKKKCTTPSLGKEVLQRVSIWKPHLPLRWH